MEDQYKAVRDYISDQQAQGVTDEAIRDSLRTSGWTDDKIDFVMPLVVAASAPTPDAAQASTPPITPTKNVDQPSVVNEVESKGVTKGRLGRLGYLIANLYIAAAFIVLILLFVLINLVVSKAAASSAGSGSLFGTPNPATTIVNVLIYIVGILFYIFAFVFSFFLQARRWHDLGQSGLLSLLSLIPGGGSVIAIILLFIKGTPGPNQFGTAAITSRSIPSLFGFSKK